MKNKNMVLIALALGCGLVAAVFTMKLSGGTKNEMVPVLVAAKNLDQGTKLDKIEDMFVRKPFPKESVPPEFIDDPAQLKDKILQRTIRAGSHCTVADITPRNGIELPVDPKTGIRYKAMAIKVSPDSMVSGLVLPGSRVDVIHALKVQDKTLARMILQNVLVVSVDTNIVRKETDQEFYKNAQTVTLAVKNTEALKLSKAIVSGGEVKLTLRSQDDQTVNPNLDSSDTGVDSEGSLVEKTKILVAKETVPAGTKIDDWNKYFAETDWLGGSAPDNFITKPESLTGQTVQKAIAKNLPPTVEAFKPDANPVKAAAAPAPKVDEYSIAIQSGGRPTQYAHYRNGRLLAVTNSPLPPGPDGKPAQANEKVADNSKTDAKPVKDEAKEEKTSKAG